MDIEKEVFTIKGLDMFVLAMCVFCVSALINVQSRLSALESGEIQNVKDTCIHKVEGE